MSKKNFLFTATVPLLITVLVFSGCAPPEAAGNTQIPTTQQGETSTQTPLPTKTPFPDATSTTSPADQEVAVLINLISAARVYDDIRGLAEIQNHSGWRNSASTGEAEALDWVGGILEEFSYLKSLGMELERQEFTVLLSTEIWESRIFLAIAGQESQVPAYAINGHKENLEEALRFDSDGKVNDENQDPVQAKGKVLVLRSGSDLEELLGNELLGKVILLDYQAVDPGPTGETAGLQLISTLIDEGIAGLILVTESGGGKYATDGTFLEGISAEGRIPIMLLRLEDLASLGIDSWEGLKGIEGAQLVWDADIFSPGMSGNLVARIPGSDPSRAVILGAHIDSANTPGAADNAINAAVLLETARVLDQAAFQPPVDLYLVWFGSEELGFHGSQAFVAAHQKLLDRTIAAFTMDGFTADKDPPIFAMGGSSYARFGNTSLPFADYLASKAEVFQIPIEFVIDSPIFNSDEGPFHGFVPAVRFAFGSEQIGRTFHSPYDSPDILVDQEDVMEGSVAMALIAALATPQDNPGLLRSVPKPVSKALILATHTEPLHMTPTMLINLDRALAWEGFDVDVIPYGQSPTEDDLADAALVLALPVVDYPTRETGFDLYDVIWSPEEIDLLVDYVEEGGFLVLTNSFHRLFFGKITDPNEDWKKVNDLSHPFGIGYAPKSFPITSIPITTDHPLTEMMTGLKVIPENGVALEVTDGEILAAWKDQVALVLVDYGANGGQVLALSDLGSLDLYDFQDDNDMNQKFIKNLARYLLSD
jgi:hypothetical protein